MFMIKPPWLQGEPTRHQSEPSMLQVEPSRIQGEHSRLQGEHSGLQGENPRHLGKSSSSSVSLHGSRLILYHSEDQDQLPQLQK
jgi:hypothetical protein